MSSFDYNGIENSSNYAFSKFALDIALEEIAKSEFAGKVTWDYYPDEDTAEEMEELFEEYREDGRDYDAEHGAAFGGPFYRKVFYLTDDKGELTEYFQLFLDDVLFFYSENTAWYNLARAILDRIDVTYRARGTSIYSESS